MSKRVIHKKCYMKHWWEEYLLNQWAGMWPEGPHPSCLFSIRNPSCQKDLQPLRTCSSCTTYGDFTCHSHQVSRKHSEFLGKMMWNTRAAVFSVCVCYLQAWVGPLLLPGSAEVHSASVLKAGQLSNNGLPRIKGGPIWLKWDTQE